jgi:hypothetical protein
MFTLIVIAIFAYYIIANILSIKLLEKYTLSLVFYYYWVP